MKIKFCSDVFDKEYEISRHLHQKLGKFLKIFIRRFEQKFKLGYFKKKTLKCINFG